MTRTTALLGFFCCTLSLVARAATIPEARTLAWIESDRAELQRTFPSLQAVNQFIQEVLPKATDENPLPITNAFTFADLVGDGNLELVCTRSDGVRFFSSIVVVAKGPRGFIFAQADDGGALDIPDLAAVIIDADGGAGKQLMLPRWLGHIYPGAAPGPIVYDIYVYEKTGRLVRENLRFAAFYRNVLLPRLSSELDGLRALPASVNATINGY